MNYGQRNLVAKGVSYTLVIVLIVAIWGGLTLLMWPLYGPAVFVVGGLETWLLMFWFVGPIVKLEMWIKRPRPIKSWELKGLVEMAADDARRKERREQRRHVYLQARAYLVLVLAVALAVYWLGVGW